MEIEDVVQGARAIFQPGMDLCQEFGNNSRNFSYMTSSLEGASRVRALAVAAIAYLEKHDGPASAYVLQSKARVAEHEESGRHVTAQRHVLEVLQTWADLVAEGVITPRSLETDSLRVVAATDLMDQVRALNADESASPAAPIVLAGAALEIALRDLLDSHDLDAPEKPGIGELSAALRRGDVISKQQKKDIDSVAGVRNDAAHGNHEHLSRERAGLVEQQVNLLLATLNMEQ